MASTKFNSLVNNNFNCGLGSVVLKRWHTEWHVCALLATEANQVSVRVDALNFLSTVKQAQQQVLANKRKGREGAEMEGAHISALHMRLRNVYCAWCQWTNLEHCLTLIGSVLAQNGMVLCHHLLEKVLPLLLNILS